MVQISYVLIVTFSATTVTSHNIFIFLICQLIMGVGYGAYHLNATILGTYSSLRCQCCSVKHCFTVAFFSQQQNGWGFPNDLGPQLSFSCLRQLDTASVRVWSMRSETGDSPNRSLLLFALSLAFTYGMHVFFCFNAALYLLLMNPF